MFGALLGTVLMSAASLTGMAVVLVPPAVAQLPGGAVTLKVLDVSPNSPTLSFTPKTLRISLQLTNTTADELKDVIVSGARSDPINSQAALDAAIAKPKPPTATLEQAFEATRTLTLRPHATVSFTFTVQTEIPTDSSLCLCANSIYPLYFQARYSVAGVEQTVASAQTYVPSFTRSPPQDGRPDDAPVKARVGWLWPLLDRPHRSTSDTLFTDDKLAAEVAPGGRLARLLEVVSKVADSVPLTIVTDPDLIDELAVMSSPEGYRVEAKNTGVTTPANSSTPTSGTSTTGTPTSGTSTTGTPTGGTPTTGAPTGGTPTDRASTTGTPTNGTPTDGTATGGTPTGSSSGTSAIGVPTISSVAGAGGDAARNWLDELRTVLADHPQLEIAFTPVADPAVEALHRNDLSWTVGLDNLAQARVTAALGGATPLTDIAWPAGETLSSGTLATLVAQGTKTVVVNDSTLTGGRTNAVVPDALAPLQTDAGPSIAAVTSAPIERQVAAVFSTSGTGVHGLAALPQLVAQVALRVEESRTLSHYVLITPPRNLDVADPRVAERAITATSVSPWSQPLALRAATSVVKPVNHGTLHPTRNAAQLSSDTLNAVRQVNSSAHSLSSLFSNPSQEPQYLPLAVQRCESSALLAVPHVATRCAQRLVDSIRTEILDKVTLVQPHSSGSTVMGSYTFTSQDSKLPVTVVNGLAAAIRVTLTVTATPSAGFTAPSVTKTIGANSKVQVDMPTNIDHPGRFEVSVGLSTPDGLALGTPISLSVRSTALGTIGVVITIAAGVVLLLALLVRFTRRVVHRKGHDEGSSATTPRPHAAASAAAKP